MFQPQTATSKRLDKFLEKQKTQKKRQSVIRESAIVNKIMEYLNHLPESKFIKLHGDGWTNRGEPDIIGAYKRRSMSIEVKRPDGKYKPTELQKRRIREWIDAGSVAFIAYGVEDVRMVIEALDVNSFRTVASIQEEVQWSRT
jgi:hypothetical protein